MATAVRFTFLCSVGALVMDQLGIDVGVYFASEIDEDAVTVSTVRYPNICHVGDIRKLADDDVNKI